MDVQSFPECDFARSKLFDILGYCENNLGPRRYYLHSKIGGARWQIKYTTNSTVTVKAPAEHLTFLAMQFG